MTHDSTAETEEGIDPETERTRLAAVEEYLAHIRDTTPYYDWLDPEIDAVERGFVRVRQPYTDRVQPPAVGPERGMNGGVVVTLIDAVGMAAIMAEALEPVGLATTGVNATFHDGADEAHFVEGEVVDLGNTLATARVEVFPESDLGATDRRVVASGEATARLFD